MSEKGGDRVVYPDKPRPVSSLSHSLDEIVKNSKKKREGGKRKRDDNSDNANSNEKANSTLTPAPAETSTAKRRATVESVSMSEVGRQVRNGVATDLWPRDDPTDRATSFEAFGGRTTIVPITSEEAYHRVTTDVLERNFRANNNVFNPMGMMMFNLRAQRLASFSAGLPIRELINLNGSLEENASSSSKPNPSTSTSTNPSAHARASTDTNATNRGNSSRRRNKRDQRMVKDLDDELDEYFQRSPDME
ncbi:hypothetical protein F4814DRAFT_377138 [Daldinia grandis]|nr:hypothetical protein F4814DRAFT_377138 [Daldinia grandis]